MAAEPTLVGLDVGTTGVKAIAVSPDGAVLAQRERGLPALDAAAGLVGAGSRGLVGRRRRRRSPRCPRGVDVAGIGLSGQMHGLVVARRRTSRVIRPALLWNDQRTAAECAEIEERVGLERLIELTGNRALTGFTAPKLLWLRRHEPEAYERIRACSCRRTTSGSA